MDKAPLDRFAVAQNYFKHVEKQVALATTKAQLLVAGLAFLLTAYVRLIVDAGVLSSLDRTISRPNAPPLGKVCKTSSVDRKIAMHRGG